MRIPYIVKNEIFKKWSMTVSYSCQTKTVKYKVKYPNLNKVQQ